MRVLKSPVHEKAMRGFMPGMWSFAVFCYVISVGIVAMGIALGFTVATASALAIQAAVLWWTQRRRAPNSKRHAT